MGFSWRGKSGRSTELPASGEPEMVTATGIDSEVANPAADLRKFKKLHKWDPFLDIDKLDTVDEVLRSGDVEKEAAVEESLLEEDSPYPEVRSSVRPLDDPELPVNTIRAWTLGFLLCTVVAACNILLGLRRSPIIITATVVQLVAYP
jgi:hypothetical protein